MISTIRINHPKHINDTVAIYHKVAVSEYGDSNMFSRIEVPITADMSFWKCSGTDDWFFTINYDNTSIMIRLDVTNTNKFYAIQE